jgi:hypothetical protein
MHGRNARRARRRRRDGASPWEEKTLKGKDPKSASGVK